jgi:uncharacterized C2H2 Zn-finger protein
MVNRRQCGYGISAATILDQLRLTRLLAGVAEDSAVAGGAPEYYTSVCLNIDFASDLHADAWNAGDSWIVTMGEHAGGHLVLEKDVQEDREMECSIDHAGSQVHGCSVDVSRQWYRFQGRRRHCTLPYSGFRVSVVYFSVPTGRCDTEDLTRLFHLGFRIPHVLPLTRLTWPFPYEIFICTTQRAGSIAKDTLSALLSDGSAPSSAITLCLKDTDVQEYRRFGLRMIVVSSDVGLPAQRAACTRPLPTGAWAVFLDDDITKFMLPDAMTMHQLFMLAFLTCRAGLWGLNVSQNPRCLRQHVSHRLGLVNGYCYGIVVDADTSSRTPTSDQVGGAAEDVERSLRYFEDSKITRLCFAAAIARTQTNPGGMQAHYSTRYVRQAARDYVVHVLCAEYPTLLRAAPESPNGCRFVRGGEAQRSISASGPGSTPVGQEEQTQSDVEDSSTDEGALTGTTTQSSQTNVEDASDGADEAPRPRRGERCACSACGKTFARGADLKYHIEQAHGDTPPATYPCPRCGKVFKRDKFLKVHTLSQRCFSRRGRVWGEQSPPLPLPHPQAA